MLELMNFYVGMKLFVDININTSRFGTKIVIEDIIIEEDKTGVTIFGNDGEELFIDFSGKAFVSEDGIEIEYDNGSSIFFEKLDG